MHHTQIILINMIIKVGIAGIGMCESLKIWTRFRDILKIFSNIIKWWKKYFGYRFLGVV